jgi:MFS superfamily sulfate permease-like transporter
MVRNEHGFVLGCRNRRHGPFVGDVPIASLVGVMLLVCQSTFSWSSLRLWNKISKVDVAVIALVSFVTVYRDLAQAVVAGTVVSALDFAWKQSADLSISSISVDKARRKVYTVKGPLFFGSTGKFSTLFGSKRDPDQVVTLDYFVIIATESVGRARGAVCFSFSWLTLARAPTSL